MHKNFKLYTPIIFLLLALSVVLTVLTAFFDVWLFILCALITAGAFAVVAYLMTQANRKVGDTLTEISDAVLYSNSDVFADTTVPTLTVYDGGEILWYNKAFSSHVLDGADFRGRHIRELFPELNVAVTSQSVGENVTYRDRQYTAFVTIGQRDGKKVSVIYFIDDTDMKNTSQEYHQSRPSVALVLVDSYEEILQDYKDLDRARLMGAIEDLIRDYFQSHHGFVARIERDRYLVVVEERGVEQIVQRKFDLLDQVRELEIQRMTATLSIGLGRGADTLSQSHEMATQAMDMCLGRGGDQAAIRTADGYEFFGGVSTGVEKRTKVKTRIIASALGEIIEASSNVIVMGHRFADLDALGAGVGMLAAARAMDKEAFICIDNEKNMVIQLMERLKDQGYRDDDFRNPEEAIKAVGRNTLLIVVDAHVPGILESEELYEACRHVVVIDHHRKLVGYIDNAVIFYHEPHASSASEMVTELVQYFPKQPKIGKPEAEALLAGITLDTKNFVMRTGVRTFEAAAWLRGRGADTVEVRRMFSSSMDSYQHKANIVAQAEIYENCAIASTEEQFEGIRIASSQAADDLMNITGVNASFVIFPYDDTINVSARSMGAINVQVIMETLGGGGHHTMAAAQFPGETVENIEKKVQQAIDDFHAALPEESRAKLRLPPAPLSTMEDIPDEGTMLEGQALVDVSASDEMTDESDGIERYLEV